MKYITLTQWMDDFNAKHPGIDLCRQTFLIWARSGKIPGAEKIGARWYVKMADEG